MKQVVAVALGILLLLGRTLYAQGGGLDAGDVALLAAANGAALNRFAFDYQLEYADNLDTFTTAATLSGSGALDRDARAVSASFKCVVTLGTMPTIPLEGEARWIDDTLYLNLGADWQAIHGASGALADRVSEYTGLSADPETLAAWNLLGIDGLAEALAAVSADPSAVVAAARLDDEGQTAHFKIMLDLHALFESDGFADAIIALGSAQGSDLMIYSRDEVVGMLGENAAAVDPAVLTIDEYIGLDDQLVHRITASLEMQIAPEKAGFSSAPFAVSLRLALDLRDQNQPQSLTAPAGTAAAQELTLPAPTLEPPGDGVSQYLFLGSIAENGSYTQAFDLHAGDVITVTARRLSLEFDTVAALLSPAGDVLAENDDQETNVYFASAYDSQVAGFPIPADGTYTVRVSASSGDGGSFLLAVGVQR